MEESVDSSPKPPANAKVFARLQAAAGSPAEAASQGGPCECCIEVFDRMLLGRQATYTLNHVAETHRSGGNTKTVELFRWTGRLDEERTLVSVPEAALDRAFCYVGPHASIRLESQIVVDDGILYDTTVVHRESRLLPQRVGGIGNAEAIINPADQYNLFKNFAALPFHRKVIVGVLMLLALGIAGVNTLIGWHDQTVPRGQSWVYSQRDSKGKSKSPLLDSLMVSGGAGAAVAAAILYQLRGYMTFQLKNRRLDVHPDLTLPIQELLTGRSRVPLTNVVLRVVAANHECGSYSVRENKKTVTKSFKKPCRGIVLFEQAAAYIPAGTPVEHAFSGDVCFAPLFAALHPPAMIDDHGVSLDWEIQLLVPDFVDQELAGPPITAPVHAFRRVESGTVSKPSPTTTPTMFADLE